MSGLYEKLREALEQNQAIAVATVVQDNTYLGKKMLIYPDGTTDGTLGHPALDKQVIVDAEQSIWKSKAEVHHYTIENTHQLDSYQHIDVFIEGFSPPSELIIIGAGHIAIALTTFAKTLNYHVVVIDARSVFATPERFPNADELIIAWPDEILEKRTLYPSTSVAVLTHDPKFDEPTLKVLLARHTGYVGAIGSRKTSAERTERLRKQGLTAEQLNRIHGPIGLNIGATSPEEIALAIIAEIVAYNHGKL
jgi:xanthine dehydrogenase accessory factor